jgi:hypothetical protein
MFEALYDELSRCWSWRWPVVEGKITAIDVERFKQTNTEETARLAVAYEFCVENDGPYTGECFWSPALPFDQPLKVRQAEHALHVGQTVEVRYRPGDPSVNMLKGGVASLLKST